VLIVVAHVQGNDRSRFSSFMTATGTGSGAVVFTDSTATTTARDMGIRGRDSFTAVAATTLSASRKPKGTSLITPPASLEHGGAFDDGHDPAEPRLGLSTLSPVDSDVSNCEGSVSSADFRNLDSTGAITPALLAKHHLSDMLLANGPLAIRHIMAHLTQTVPGFSAMPAAKARRIVVAALEGRGGNGSLAGPDGNAVFEKIGWGRWSAHIKGQAPQAALRVLSPEDEYQHPNAISILNSTGRSRKQPTSQDWKYEPNTRDMDDDMMDKMSMDGDDMSSSRSVSEDEVMHGLDDEDTDVEDWESAFPALQAASYGKSPGPWSGPSFTISPHVYSGGYSGTSKPSLPQRHDIPILRRPELRDRLQQITGDKAKNEDSAERAAVEALLQLRSI
jgi:hypothetical protein